MWSLVSLVALALCVPILQVQRVFGQRCKFALEDGTVIEENAFGYNLPITSDIEKPGKELLVAAATDVKKITGITSTSKRHYIKATLEKAQLFLTLTDEFVHYEEYESSKTTTTTVSFECVEGTTKIEFVLPIEDSNNHAPNFVDAPYIYRLPMPLPKNLALNYFAPIAARDIDLTNTNISFSLDPNVGGFSVSWLPMDSTDRKLRNATLVTTAVINLVEDMTFYLYATDTGIPPLTSNTTVTIKVDRANSILRFALPLYTANLTNLLPESATGKVITFAEGDVRLESGSDKTVEYTIQDEYSDYVKAFELLVADDRVTVQLRLINPPATFFQETFVLLRLIAKKPGAMESTFLHIFPPGFFPQCVESGGDDYLMATIVLGTLLGFFAVGLLVSVFTNRRGGRK